ncbi:hypothetical protein J5A52_04580 [TM7 phylum sp. oral taxon 349]|nr:hypothetical protein J5A52_04580 [TM7 phylum sp. oral taxon 349]
MPRNHSEMPSSGQFSRNVNERGVEDLLSGADVSSGDTGSIGNSDSRFAITITPAEAAGFSSGAHDTSSGGAANSRGESDVSHQTTPEGARDDSDSNDRQTSSMLRPAAEQATPIMSGSEVGKETQGESSESSTVQPESQPESVSSSEDDKQTSSTPRSIAEQSASIMSGSKIHEEMQGEKFNQETQELINSDGVAWAIASALKDAAKTRSEKIRGEASTYIGAVDAVLKRATKRQGLPSDKEEVDSSVRDVLDNSPGLRYVVEASARRGSMSKSELDELEAKLLRYNSFLAKSQAALSLDESIPSVNVPSKFEGEISPGSEAQASGSSDKQKPQRENDSSDNSESTVVDKDRNTKETENDKNTIQNSINFINLQLDFCSNALNSDSISGELKESLKKHIKMFEESRDTLQEQLGDTDKGEKSRKAEAEASKSLDKSDKGVDDEQTPSTPRSAAEQAAEKEEQAKREREQEQEDYNAALADYARLRSEEETKGSFASEKLRPLKGLIGRIFGRKNGTESRHSKREREIIEAENRLKKSALKIAKRRAEAAEAVLPSEDAAQMRADLMVGALHKLLDVDVRQAINNEIAQQQEKRGFMDKKFLVPMGRWLSKGGKWTRRAKNFGVGITAGVFAPIGILTGVAAAATSAAVHRGSRLAAIDENLKRHQDAQGNAIAQLSGEEVMRKYDSYRNQSTPDTAIGDGIADFASWMLEAQRGMSHDDAKRSMKEARKNVAMIGLGFGLGKLASLGANMLLDSTDTSVTLKGTKPGNVEVHDIPKGAEKPTESLVDRLHDAANVSKPDGDTLWDIVANEIGSDKASGAIYKVTDALEQAGHTIEWINKGTDHAQVFIDGRDDVSYLYSMYNVGKSLLGQ